MNAEPKLHLYREYCRENGTVGAMKERLEKEAPGRKEATARKEAPLRKEPSERNGAPERREAPARKEAPGKNGDTEVINKYVDETIDYFTIKNPALLTALERGLVKKAAFEEEVMKHVLEFPLTEVEKQRVYDSFSSFVWTYDVIDPLIRDGDVSDIKILSADRIRVKRLGKRMGTEVAFRSSSHYRKFVSHIAAKNKINLSNMNAMQTFTDKDSSPDFRLRFNIATEFVNSTDEPYVHIRKIPKAKKELVAMGTLSGLEAEYLSGTARADAGMLFCGKGASGKTTCMDAPAQTAAITIGVESDNYQFQDASLTVTTGFRIGFVSRGGSQVQPQYAPAGGRLTQPEPPVKKGFQFLAWCRDKELSVKWDFAADTVTGDTTLYAKWGHPFDAGIVVDEIPDQPYTGKAIKPQLTAWDGETPLTPGKDYTVTYSDNTKASVDGLGNTRKDGKGKEVKPPTAIIKGKGNYKNKGTTKVTFAITPVSLGDNADITVTGKEYYAAPSGRTGAVSLNLKVICGKKTLSSKNDYTITRYLGAGTTEGNEVEAIREARVYTILFTGKGNYAGTISKAIQVSPGTAKLLEKASVKLEYASAPYADGTQLSPKVEQVKLSGTVLDAEKDYEVSYGRNQDPGTGTVTIRARKDSAAYAGEKTVTFKITGIPLSKAKITGFQSKPVYTGSPIEQTALTLTMQTGTGASASVQTLVKDRDYTINDTGHPHAHAGKATLLITGKGKYTGTIQKSYTITKPNLANREQSRQFTASSAAGSAKQNRAGAILEDICVEYLPKDNQTGQPLPVVKLEEGKDYTVSYQNNQNIGSATAVITGKGNYAGRLKEKIPFTITAKELTSEDITVKVADARFQNKTTHKPSVTVYDNGKKLFQRQGRGNNL